MTSAPAKTRPKRKHPRRAPGLPSGLPVHHERFCQGIAEGLSASESYREHVAAEWTERVTAQVNASRLLSDERIRLRIKELRVSFKDFLADKLGYTQETQARFLVDIVATPIGDIDGAHPLAQKITYTDKGGLKSIEMPGKLAAAEQIAKLAGWNAPEKIDATISTHPVIDSALKKLFARPERDVTPAPARIAAKAKRAPVVIEAS